MHNSSPIFPLLHYSISHYSHQLLSSPLLPVRGTVFQPTCSCLDLSVPDHFDPDLNVDSDLKGCLQPGDSACSLPSLLKEVQGSFSSAEYLDSTSTSYPSSPALSSNKVSSPLCYLEICWL